jgi:hypothetical protein
MSLLARIRELLNRRKGRLIKFGELALPEGQQFQAYRKLVLDELGTEGLERDLLNFLEGEPDAEGTGRNRRGMKGGSP